MRSLIRRISSPIVQSRPAPRDPTGALSDAQRAGAQAAGGLIERATSANTRRTYATALPQPNVAVVGWCLAVWIALPGTALVGAQPPAVEPPPSVAVIDQRLRETAQDPSLDEAATATVRGLYQRALSELESAARWRVTALDFARRTTEAPAALSELEAGVAAPPPSAAPVADSPGQRWLQRSMTDGAVATLEQELAEVRTQLAEAAT